MRVTDITHIAYTMYITDVTHITYTAHITYITYATCVANISDLHMQVVYVTYIQQHTEHVHSNSPNFI